MKKILEDEYTDFNHVKKVVLQAYIPEEGRLFTFCTWYSESVGCLTMSSIWKNVIVVRTKHSLNVERGEIKERKDLQSIKGPLKHTGSFVFSRITQELFSTE